MSAPTLAVEEAPVPTTSQRRHPKTFTEMLVSSIIGLVASLVLSIDAVTLAANPNADLSCNINAAISCGKVGLSWQASLLGFPNAFLGLIAEPVVITIAVAALGGVRFPRWFMNAAQVVYFIGFAFAFWLFYQAYFVIGALCPWCLLITITTTTVFVSLLRINILDNNLGLPSRIRDPLVVGLRAGADTMGVIIIFAILAGMIFIKYGSVIFGG